MGHGKKKKHNSDSKEGIYKYKSNNKLNQVNM